MLSSIIIIALLNTTLILVFKKWEWLDLYAAYRRSWMPAVDCYLCMAFWLSCIEIGAGIGIYAACFTWAPSIFAALPPTAPAIGVILIPLCSAPLTQHLVFKALTNDLR